MTCAEPNVIDKQTGIRSGSVSPFRTASERFAAGRMGMLIFLVSLAILFIASLVGYGVIRIQLSGWPRDLPPLPLVLLVSTMILILSSCVLQAALISIRENKCARTARLMLATTLLGLLFLIMQAFAWNHWFAAVGDQWNDSQPYRWALASFYVLTGIHALHVVGGIAPMIVVTANAIRGRYDAQRHAGIHYCAMYWHFLGGVWIVLYLTLLIGT